MKTLLLLLVASIELYAQFQTPLTVFPTPGSGSGATIRLRKGDYFVGLQAPSSLGGNKVWQMPPVDGTAGQALVTDGGFGLSWSSVAGGSAIPTCTSSTGNDSYTCTITGFTSYSTGYCAILTADAANTGTATVDITGVGAKSILRYGGSALSTNDILVSSPQMICYDGTSFQLPPSASPGSGAFLNGGNSFGAAATLGTNDNYDLNFKRNNITLVAIAAGGVSLAPTGIANFYTQVTKLNVGDITGAGGFWDIQASGSFAASANFKLRDPAGSRALLFDRAILGTPLNNFGVFGNLIPRQRATGDGDAVSDSVNPNLGGPTAYWENGYISKLYADQLLQSLYPTPTNTIQIGGVSNRLSNLYSVLGNFSGAVGAVVFTSTTPNSGFHESLNLVNTYAGDGAAPAITWKVTTGSGAGTAIGDIEAATLSGTAGAEQGIMTFRVIENGTINEYLKLNGSTGFVDLNNGYLSINGGSEPYTRVHLSDYNQVPLGKMFVVDVWNSVPSSDSGGGKFVMTRKTGAGTIAGGNRTDVRALETHVTCEDGRGYCWAQEMRVGSLKSPTSQTLENVGLMIESKAADWVASPSCDGAGTNGCVNNMGVVVLGRDGWEWPFAYLDSGNRVDWFVDDVGRTNTRAVRFLDIGGVSGYNLYWEAVAVATTSNSYWILKDSGGTDMVGIYTKLAGTPLAEAYWSVNLNPGVNLGASLGNSSLYWNNVYGLNFTTGPIVPTVTATYSVGNTGARYIRAFLSGGITAAGQSLFEATSSIVMRSGATLTMDACTTTGYVLTVAAAGLIDCAVSGSSQWINSGTSIYYPGPGYVGIGAGASTPVAPLHISNTNAAIFMDGYTAFAPNIVMRQSRGTAGAETPTQSGDRMGQIAVQGYGGSRVTSARVKFVAPSTHTGSSNESIIIFSTTANGATSTTDQWEITSAGSWIPVSGVAQEIGASGTRVNKYWGGDMDLSGRLLVSTSATISALTMAGNQTPGLDGLGSIGTVSVRYGAFRGYTADFAGAVSMTGSTITASSTFSSDLIPTLNGINAQGSASKRWLGYFSTLNVSGTLILGGTVTGSIDWAGGSLYSVGSFAKKTNTVYANYVDVYTELGIHGDVTTPTGAFGMSATLTCPAGQAVKNLTVEKGIVTYATCGAP